MSGKPLVHPLLELAQEILHWSVMMVMVMVMVAA